jgi:hypothetical protein
MRGAATEATIHAWKIDALQERQKRGGKSVTHEQQRRWLYEQRRLLTQFNRPEAVQVVNAILASVAKAERFTRKR